MAADLAGEKPARPVVDLAQGRERQRQHHPVGAHLEGAAAATRECARVRPVGVSAQGGQRRLVGDRPGREPGRQAMGDLVGAAVHPEPLVRVAVERERPAGRLAQLGDHRQGAADGDVHPILRAIGLADQAAELRVAAAGDARVEPVGDRHLVQLAGGPRRGRKRAQVALERRIDGGEIAAGAVVGVAPAAELEPVGAQTRRACRRRCRRGAGRAPRPAGGRRAGRCRRPRRPARRSGRRRSSRAGSSCGRRPGRTPRRRRTRSRAGAAGART